MKYPKKISIKESFKQAQKMSNKYSKLPYSEQLLQKAYDLLNDKACKKASKQ